MPTPGEHKTVQARILEYAEAIGWTMVSREEAEQRRGFDPDVPPDDRAKNRSLFSDDLLDAKVREFNPRYAEAVGALLGQFRHLHTDVYGNRELEADKLEAKVKSFCAIPQALAFLKDYIVFAEKNEELNKYILRQHQTGAVEATVSRALDPERTRGLVWHTQGSGKRLLP